MGHLDRLRPSEERAFSERVAEAASRLDPDGEMSAEDRDRDAVAMVRNADAALDRDRDRFARELATALKTPAGTLRDQLERLYRDDDPDARERTTIIEFALALDDASRNRWRDEARERAEQDAAEAQARLNDHWPPFPLPCELVVRRESKWGIGTDMRTLKRGERFQLQGLRGFKRGKLRQMIDQGWWTAAPGSERDLAAALALNEATDNPPPSSGDSLDPAAGPAGPPPDRSAAGSGESKAERQKRQNRERQARWRERERSKIAS